MAKRSRVPGKRDPSYLGRAMPPRGWLLLNEGKEITCSGGHYYLDPGHKRKGHKLVAIGGELFEVSKVGASPDSETASAVSSVTG